MPRKAKIKSNNQVERGNLETPFVSDFLGSVWFLCIILILIILYIIWNAGFIPWLHPFDPSPFNILDTILSVFAIILSITVLISQKRQRQMEKVREQVEFEVNVRAETEITKILEMLEQVQQKLGINTADEDMEQMKKKLDIRKLHERIKKSD
jgi:uncharacterized membrane protein